MNAWVYKVDTTKIIDGCISWIPHEGESLSTNQYKGEFANKNGDADLSRVGRHVPKTGGLDVFINKKHELVTYKKK